MAPGPLTEVREVSLVARVVNRTAAAHSVYRLKAMAEGAKLVKVIAASHSVRWKLGE